MYTRYPQARMSSGNDFWTWRNNQETDTPLPRRRSQPNLQSISDDDSEIERDRVRQRQRRSRDRPSPDSERRRAQSRDVDRRSERPSNGLFGLGRGLVPAFGFGGRGEPSNSPQAGHRYQPYRSSPPPAQPASRPISAFQIPQPRSSAAAPRTSSSQAADAAVQATGRLATRFTPSRMIWGYRPAFLVPLAPVGPQYVPSEEEEPSRKRRWLRLLAALLALLLAIGLLVTIAVLVAMFYNKSFPGNSGSSGYQNNSTYNATTQAPLINITVPTTNFTNNVSVYYPNSPDYRAMENIYGDSLKTLLGDAYTGHLVHYFAPGSIICDGDVYLRKDTLTKDIPGFSQMPDNAQASSISTYMRQALSKAPSLGVVLFKPDSFQLTHEESFPPAVIQNLKVTTSAEIKGGWLPAYTNTNSPQSQKIITDYCTGMGTYLRGRGCTMVNCTVLNLGNGALNLTSVITVIRDQAEAAVKADIGFVPTQANFEEWLRRMIIHYVRSIFGLNIVSVISPGGDTHSSNVPYTDKDDGSGNGELPNAHSSGINLINEGFRSN